MTKKQKLGKLAQAKGQVYKCIDRNCNETVSGINGRCRSCSKKGTNNPMFNRELTQDHKNKISKSLKNNTKAIKALRKSLLNKKSRAWKGKSVGYHGGHWRINKKSGQPSVCCVCGNKDNKETYEWASLDKKWYTKKNYIRACKKCHSKLDNTVLNLNWYKKWIIKKNRIIKYQEWFLMIIKRLSSFGDIK
jgi:hypothetical protein